MKELKTKIITHKGAVTHAKLMGSFKERKDISVLESFSTFDSKTENIVGVVLYRNL